jgi:menaquinone-9 beta-reductase
MRPSVIIVGAGPSGCSAAIALRGAGLDVVLADKGNRGRDKVCGDALIPDALDALQALGCLDEVLARSHAVSCLRICTPDHPSIHVRGRLACIPRSQLDGVLLASAQAAGAEFLPAMSFAGLLERAGRVSGVRLLDVRGVITEIQADHVLLATGAAASPLESAGMCVRRSPSGVGMRAYFELPASLVEELDAFTLHYDRMIAPGYGWIFAGPNRVFNVGVGYFQDGWRQPKSSNVRELWSWFLDSCASAAKIRKFGRQLTPVRGAPLRTSLQGARITRPGLMLVGEAIGTTYAFSGEGIGKAMQSGVLAAECLARDPQRAEVVYEQQLQTRFRAQYDAYRIAQSCLSLPWVWNLLARSAHRGSYVRSRFEGLLAETEDPRELFSAGGLIRAAFA